MSTTGAITQATWMRTDPSRSCTMSDLCSIISPYTDTFEVQIFHVDKRSRHRPVVDSGFDKLNHQRGDQASASAGLVRRRRNPHHIVHAIKAAYTTHGTVRLKRSACPVDVWVTTTAFTVASIR